MQLKSCIIWKAIIISKKIFLSFNQSSMNINLKTLQQKQIGKTHKKVNFTIIRKTYPHNSNDFHISSLKLSTFGFIFMWLQ
jgi:hypothetical protein